MISLQPAFPSWCYGERAFILCLVRAGPPVGEVRFAQHDPRVVAWLFHKFPSQTKFIIGLPRFYWVYVKECVARARHRMYRVSSPRSPVGFTGAAGHRVAG